MILYKLFAYQESSDPSLRSHYYRHRSILQKKLSEIPFAPWFGEKDAELIRLLSKFGPLEPADLQNQSQQSKLRKWNQILPQDPHFFRMLEGQMQLYKNFSESSIERFFESPEAKAWALQRAKLNRPPLFELDQFFKSSKTPALHREKVARALLRSQPLLRLIDLQEMGLKNAQTIWERFPFRELYRRSYLDSLKSNLSAGKSSRRLDLESNPIAQTFPKAFEAEPQSVE